MLERAVRRLTQDARYQLVAGAGGALAGLSVAPEYLFADMTSVAGKQIGDYERWLVSNTMQRVSNDYPAVLLFPGTIAYRHQMKTRGDVRAALEPHAPAALHPAGSDDGVDVPRKVMGNPISSYAQQHRSEIENHQKKMERLQEASRGLRKKTLYAARNSAFGLFGGQIVMAYHKRGEVGEVTQQDAPVFFVNGNRPGTCTVAGVDFGLEVCKDSTEGYLRGTGIDDLDVHVVLSASVEIRDIRKAPGAVLIHACQAVAHSGVTDTADQAVASYASHKVGGWKLDLDDLTI